MNKKGFAISVILYAIVFLIISIFYILLAIVKTRYNEADDLKKSIITSLNSMENVYSKLENDNPVNVLIINPNGGVVEINGEVINAPLRIIGYAGDQVELSPATHSDVVNTDNFYTLSYNANGGTPTPATQSVMITSTSKYTFTSWEGDESCATEENVYTFPLDNGVICTKTARWGVEVNNVTQPVNLANAPTRLGYAFTGWKSSGENNMHGSGTSYLVTRDTVMTAQWEVDIDADEVSYSNSSTNLNCDNVQCAINEIDSILE